MKRNLWIFDNNKKKSTPQALISLYIIAGVLIAIAITVGMLLFLKNTYNSVPRWATYASAIIVIGIPTAIILWNYIIASSPKSLIRAYPIYLDDDGELWLFDYNSIAFEDYYDDQIEGPDGKLPHFSRFSGNHKERTVEYCVAHESVKDIIKEPPFDSYAHHIVQVGKIVEKGGYLSVTFLCHSQANNKNYSAGMALPLSMEGLSELRELLEAMAANSDTAMALPKEHNEPGVMRIERIYDDEDGYAILYGIMEVGTITRADRVNYTDADKNIIFECKANHIYRDGHEIVWATPVSDGNDPGYEVHVKKHSGSDFQVGHYLLSKYKK